MWCDWPQRRAVEWAMTHSLAEVERDEVATAELAAHLSPISGEQVTAEWPEPCTPTASQSR